MAPAGPACRERLQLLAPYRRCRGLSQAPGAVAAIFSPPITRATASLAFSEGAWLAAEVLPGGLRFADALALSLKHDLALELSESGEDGQDQPTSRGPRIDHPPPRFRMRKPQPPSSTASSRFTMSHKPIVERAKRSTLVTTKVSSRGDPAQCAAGARPPSLTLRRLIASGTAASESSISTQNTST
jgi:hypothetical protein